MCLRPTCPYFFNTKASVQAVGDSWLPPPSVLSYSAELLRLQPADHLPTSEAFYFPLQPSKINTTARPFAKGMHCQACGRLSTRYVVPIDASRC